MSGATATTDQPTAIPEFDQVLGHPKPLWMLFMAEFWERFAFYGIRWALVLYIVAQFYNGDATGQAPAGLIYGSYLALVYAGAIFGGYVADRYIGYQRSILVGAVIMAIGLFLVSIPNQDVFKLGLATIVVGNGLFKPIISTVVGKIYAQGDERRDSGFTIFYMGINAGAFIAPILTQILAEKVFGTEAMPAYKVVFIAAAIGMLISTFWFWLGRGQLKGIGAPPAGGESLSRVLVVAIGAACVVPVVYFLLALGAQKLQLILTVMFVLLAVMLLIEGIRNGKEARDKVIAMLIIFAFNILFWMFFEQAGSSFNFLAEKLVDRDLFGAGGFVFPTGWFQSVNPAAIVLLAPVITLIWAALAKGKLEPSIPRKFGLGLIGNALGFAILMYALTNLVDPGTGMLPFWPLVACYVLQTMGELCLSPIGLSMVTKLAPASMVGFAMGGWFLSTAIGNNLSGLLAGHISGESGMTVESALGGFTFSFQLLIAAGILLFLIAPLINKLMHGVK